MTEFVNWDDEIPNICRENKPSAPNHQPALIWTMMNNGNQHREDEKIWKKNIFGRKTP